MTSLSLCFAIVASILFGLSSVPRDFYIASVIESGFLLFRSAVMAAYSKLVDKDETAKANAIISAILTTFVMIFVSFYNLIYRITIATLPGAYYFVSTGCFMCGLGASIFLRIYSRRFQGEAAGELEQLIKK